MVKTKKLIQMAMKWRQRAAIARRRISNKGTDAAGDPKVGRKTVAAKGHFVVYSTDGRRFKVPLKHLSSPIFEELFKMSEEVFGLAYGNQITLPCEAVFMEYVLSLVRKQVSCAVEMAVVTSLSSCRYPASAYGF